MNQSEQTAKEYAIGIKEGIKRKADSNKTVSTFLFLVVLFSTVLCPVLILISSNEYVSKYLPAILSAGAALASYWMQLRKPQDRWVIYRTAQREIEYEIDQYTFGTGSYSIEDKEKTLAAVVSKRALQLHYEWMPMVPKIEDIEKLKKPKKDENL